MVWFRFGFYNPGPPGNDSYADFCATNPCGATQLQPFNNINNPQPGVTYYNTYELVDNSVYHWVYLQQRTHNHVDYSSIVVNTIDTGPSSTGPWTNFVTQNQASLFAGDGTYTMTMTNIDSLFGPPPPPCQYGTRKKATSPAIDLLTEAAIVGALTAAGLTWWEVLLLVFAGQQIDVNALCSALPPQPPTPTPDALNYPPYKLLEYLYQNMWGYYCECVPGSPSPTNPPAGTGTKPGGMPDPRVIVVNPTNPCLDLTEVRRMLDTVIRQLNVDVQLDTLMQRYSLPFATVLGAAHSGLTATGSFAISRLIGVQIVITDRGPNRELEGAPNYVWDLGWISCMDGNGFIQERRITRDVEVWMPREFQEATTLGYVFKDGVTARIVELEAEV